MAAEPEPRPFITKVWAKNFRSIEYAELELGPLTVLVGPNASGKSNLLDVLGFLADAARHGLETAITRRGGIGSIGRRSPTGGTLSPEIGLLYEFQGGTLQYNFMLTRRGNGEYQVRREFARLETDVPGVGQPEVEIINGRLTKPNLKGISKRAESTKNEDTGHTDSYVGIIDQLVAGLDTKYLLLITEEPSLTTMLAEILISQSNPVEEISGFYLLRQAFFNLRRDLGKVELYHIFPRALRSPQMVADIDNLVHALRDMVQKKSRFLPELKEALSIAVPGIMDIRVIPARSYYVVELKHERNDGTGKGLWFDLAQESDGTLRLLAMLTALFQDPAPSLIGLEEPELAIHPGAMSVLAENMVEASLRGQVLVSTHSPDLIDLLPLESIRAVSAEDGSTRVGKVAEYQLKSVRDNLFSPGELHSMGGLQPAGAGKPGE